MYSKSDSSTQCVWEIHSYERACETFRINRHLKERQAGQGKEQVANPNSGRSGDELYEILTGTTSNNHENPKLERDGKLSRNFDQPLGTWTPDPSAHQDRGGSAIKARTPESMVVPALKAAKSCQVMPQQIIYHLWYGIWYIDYLWYLRYDTFI